MKRPLGIYFVCLAVLASLAAALSTWTEIVPRLIAVPGPRTWIEILAVLVLSALPFSVPPAVIGAWERAAWAPAAVLVWGALWIAEMILTVVAAGSLAGLRGPEWVLPWIAVLFAVYALARLVGYVGRVVAAASAPDRASST